MRRVILSVASVAILMARPAVADEAPRDVLPYPLAASSPHDSLEMPPERSRPLVSSLGIHYDTAPICLQTNLAARNARDSHDGANLKFSAGFDLPTGSDNAIPGTGTFSASAGMAAGYSLKRVLSWGAHTTARFDADRPAYMSVADFGVRVIFGFEQIPGLYVTGAFHSIVPLQRLPSRGEVLFGFAYKLLPAMKLSAGMTSGPLAGANTIAAGLTWQPGTTPCCNVSPLHILPLESAGEYRGPRAGQF